MNKVVGPSSEKITTSEPLSIDEAVRKKRAVGDVAKSLEKQIIDMQESNPQFKDIMSVVFGWKRQDDGSKKLVSKHPSGKILFPDKSRKCFTPL